MNKLTLSLMAAAAAVAFGTSATASVTLAENNGQLSTHINSSTLAAAPQDALLVWGSTLSGGGSHDVDFTGNTTLHISPGAGFAAITDPNGNGDITSLIIDPTVAFNFSAIDFSVQTYQDTYIFVQYMLASGVGGWLTPGGLGDPFFQAASQLKDYIISASAGEVLGAIRISTCSTVNCTSPGAGIFFEKQNSITLVSAVPEPATWAMMLLGFGGMGVAMRRRRRRTGAHMMQIA